MFDRALTKKLELKLNNNIKTAIKDFDSGELLVNAEDGGNSWEALKIDKKIQDYSFGCTWQVCLACHDKHRQHKCESIELLLENAGHYIGTCA